jgi:hypothetical protein
MSNSFTKENSTSSIGTLGDSKVGDKGLNDKNNWDYYKRMLDDFFKGLFSDDLTSKTKFDAQYSDGLNNALGYYVTNKPQTSKSTNLNNAITNTIKMLFEASGPNQNAPTQQMKDLFNQFTQGQYPTDDIHIRKLRMLVYYLMSRIIPGLPTQKNPVTYVIWKPLSNA